MCDLRLTYSCFKTWIRFGTTSNSGSQPWTFNSTNASSTQENASNHVAVMETSSRHHTQQMLFFVYPSESFHSSFFVFLLLYLMCSSPTCLPHSLFPLEPLPSQLLSLIHHLLAFFFLSICVFSRNGERKEDGLRLCSRYWLSFVLLICFISI